MVPCYLLCMQNLPPFELSYHRTARVFQGRSGKVSAFKDLKVVFASECYSMCVLACVGLNGGLVGMSVCAALTLMGMFQWAIRQSAEVENLVRWSKHPPSTHFYVFLQFFCNNLHP